MTKARLIYIVIFACLFAFYAQTLVRIGVGPVELSTDSWFDGR